MPWGRLVNRLSAPQRNALIKHALGPMPIDNRISPEGARLRSTIGSLCHIRLLRQAQAAARPTHTVLTDKGREVLCCLLGQYADALVAVGFLDGDTMFNERLAMALSPSIDPIETRDGVGGSSSGAVPAPPVPNDDVARTGTPAPEGPIDKD